MEWIYGHFGVDGIERRRLQLRAPVALRLRPLDRLRQRHAHVGVLGVDARRVLLLLGEAPARTVARCLRALDHRILRGVLHLRAQV